MPRFGRFQLECRVELERAGEIGAALPLAGRDAADESEILVRDHLVCVTQTGIERILEMRRRRQVLPVFVVLDSGRELGLALTLENALDILHGLRGTAGEGGKTDQQDG